MILTQISNVSEVTWHKGGIVMEWNSYSYLKNKEKSWSLHSKISTFFYISSFLRIFHSNVINAVKHPYEWLITSVLPEFMPALSVSLHAFLPDAFLSATPTLTRPHCHSHSWLTISSISAMHPGGEKKKNVFKDQRGANFNKFPFLLSTNTQTRQIRGYTNTAWAQAANAGVATPHWWQCLILP